MFEEDSLLDEQIRKKKRFVLLALVTLLLIGTFAALSLVGPTAPSLQTVAELEKTSTPDQSTSTPSIEATIASGPTSRAFVTSETTAHPVATEGAGAATPSATAEPTLAGSEIPATAEASPDEFLGDAWQEPGTPPGNGAETTRPGEGASASTVATEETLDINELPRVHEIWGPTGADEALSTPEASATTPVVPTIGLTHTSALSETELVAPPDGLPVTGTNMHHPRLNWAAMAIVVVLLGAGITALCRPNSGQS